MRENKTYRKIINKYLDDERVINKLFSRSNMVLKAGMYANFMNWCSDKRPKLKYKSKGIFFEEVLSRPEYYECIKSGYLYIVNRKVDSKGTGVGVGELTVF